MSDFRGLSGREWRYQEHLVWRCAKLLNPQFTRDLFAICSGQRLLSSVQRSIVGRLEKRFRAITSSNSLVSLAEGKHNRAWRCCLYSAHMRGRRVLGLILQYSVVLCCVVWAVETLVSCSWMSLVWQLRHRRSIDKVSFSRPLFAIFQLHAS